ncbi:MAG: alpha-L-fucosidase, partial [Terracidiphilus sp.]
AQSRGDPSPFGYKYICHIRKAERWDPEALISLFKRAEADYMVVLAMRHDSYDCWNSMNVELKRNIGDTWVRVACANGLQFGVSGHGTPHRVWDGLLPVRYIHQQSHLRGS